MKSFDLIIIGGGPGGYVAAIRAAQFGKSVALVEREPQLGGTCLRVGCIPSKALLESSERFVEAQSGLAAHGVKVERVSLDLAAMLRRKDEIVSGLATGVEALIKKNRITWFLGHGRLDGAMTADGSTRMNRVAVSAVSGKTSKEAELLTAPHVIVATGSRVAPLKGVEPDGDRICTSTEALSLSAVPEHLVVIGAGYIGLELGSVWRRLGAKVTVLEYLPRILPGMDSEVADAALRIFRKQGIEFRLGCEVTSASVQAARGGSKKRGTGDEAGPCVVQIRDQAPISCDRVLLAVGRVPNTDDVGLDSLKIERDSRGRIVVNDHFETAAPGVYAVGDAIRGPMLAHKAEDEGLACAERLYGGYGHVNYDAIPGVAYTHPEIAGVGRTEDELRSAGVAYRRGMSHFRGNARARALADTEGFVKVLADATTDRILGVHIIGPRAGDLIAEAAAAIEFGASAEDLARTCHAHPTLPEVLREAAMAVDGRAIHA
ncbi:MAG: dihydrolipoyl dehydrogenase [Planctomycetia bacterium]|nr:MAG: dihydrolipoyl dehydrogenase [Planctomycetia bacterium]